MARRAAKSKKAPAVKKAGVLTKFARMISVERQRLQKILEDAFSRKSLIDREIAGIQQELNAMGAFVSAKLGMSGKRRAKRSPRGQKRQQVLDTIKSVPQGLTRGEIIQKLNAAEKSAQQSISNALSALFKSKAVKRENGRYRAA